ncbi:MAG: carboxypeptidase-like regulatory domain-containing protein, partial [Bacteroidales bacterium]|nr:carboxypeptidase-like regulatory domain-containing protein [Bacteroidales bacterium]
MRNKMLAIIALAMLIPILAPAQDKGIKLFGYVFDSDTKTPIPGATVLVDQNQAGMSTNKEGYFSFSNVKTPALFYFSCVGYESRQMLVQSADSLPVKVYLKAEIRKIGEVTISGEKIAKLVRGDTLNIVDYEISNDRIIMVANPYKHLDDQKLYLTALSGDVLNSEKISLAGAKIDIPESIDVVSTVYLFKDCYRNIHLLTRDSAYQVAVDHDTLKRLYPIDIYDFTSLLLPVKAELNGRLFSQKSTLFTNETFCIKKGEETFRLIKTVNDPYGSYRYVKIISVLEKWGMSNVEPYEIKHGYERFVGAPVVRRADDVLI